MGKENEPLKNKRFVYDEEEDDFVRDKSEDGKVYTTLRNDAFVETDIKSAIEWLKEELEKGAESSEEFDYIWVDRIINEAFEDVIKK